MKDCIFQKSVFRVVKVLIFWKIFICSDKVKDIKGFPEGGRYITNLTVDEAVRLFTINAAYQYWKKI